MKILLFVTLLISNLHAMSITRIYNSDGVHIGSLLGTMHGGIRDSEFTEKMALAVIQGHETVFGEYDNVTNYSREKAFAEMERVKSLTSIEQILNYNETKDLFEKVDLKLLNLSRAEVLAYNPIAFSETVMMPCFENHPMNISMDIRLLRIARINKVKVASLETIDDQTLFYRALDKNEQKNHLFNSIEFSLRPDCRGLSNKYMLNMATAVLDGNYDSSYEFTYKLWGILLGREKYYQTIIDGRNDKMTLNIHKLLNDKRKYLFAVGITHLGGENGIIKQLAKLGYSFRKVKIEP